MVLSGKKKYKVPLPKAMDACFFSGLFKRFFDEKDIKFFFKDFDIEYLNEEIMTRYKLEKRLYRVCVRKK